jgi:hypothetical protein
MELRDAASATAIRRLEMALTRSEAEEMRDTLEILLAGDPGRHEHVPSADYQAEVTIWLSDPPSA